MFIRPSEFPKADANCSDCVYQPFVQCPEAFRVVVRCLIGFLLRINSPAHEDENSTLEPGKCVRNVELLGG